MLFGDVALYTLRKFCVPVVWGQLILPNAIVAVRNGSDRLVAGSVENIDTLLGDVATVVVRPLVAAHDFVVVLGSQAVQAVILVIAIISAVSLNLDDITAVVVGIRKLDGIFARCLAHRGYKIGFAPIPRGNLIIQIGIRIGKKGIRI